ncbi:MAG TPA: hypothetical protein PLR88_01130 [Bacteroidales bacterium]|nr:hypothetical protein [Bacteroidales bacterium]
MLPAILTILLISSLTLLPAGGCPADTAGRSPSHIYFKAQYAGNLGFASVGAGSKFFNDKLSLDLNYGYMPEFINGTEVHTIALKPAFHFKEFVISGFKAGFYIGTALNYNITSNTYIKFPGYYPEGYYVPNALHANPFLGAKTFLPARKLSCISLYTELGTVEYKILCAIKNRKIEFDEIWNLCFGIVFHLK